MAANKLRIQTRRINAERTKMKRDRAKAKKYAPKPMKKLRIRV